MPCQPGSGCDEEEIAMALTGHKVAFLVSKEGIEQVELTEPWKAVEEAGATPRLISVKPGTVQGFSHLDRADTFRVEITSWPSMATDFRNAGAEWVDAEVIVDEGDATLISSRKPADLPAFCRELVAWAAKG
jgi:putative intracellular protease/amidase